MKKVTVALSVLFVLFAVIFAAGCITEEQPSEPTELLVSTTTSLHDTGLLDAIQDYYLEKYNVDLKFTPQGTGNAIASAKKGDADVLLVHSPSQEAAFIEEGYGVNHRGIAYNYFVIVGPAADPAGIKGMTPEEGLKKLEELGIGRPSTYAPTISTLTKGRGYITKGDKEGVKTEVTNLTLKSGKITSTKKVETIGAEKGRLLPQEIGMIVTDYLVNNFDTVLDYRFTANVEEDFDAIAEGNQEWNSMISSFYEPFHKQVDEILHNGEYSKTSRELGIDPSDGQPLVARYGQYGPYVQKGDGENKTYASLAPGQLIESITLEEAIKLFELPRTVGQYEGIDIICTKGRFGPYIKYGSKNVALPKGTNPVSIDLDSCIKLITEAETKAANAVLAHFEASDIQVINGAYGPYIKHAGNNYKLPKGTDAATLTKEKCLELIQNSEPTGKKRRKK